MIASFHLEPVEASRKLAGGGRWSRSVWELTADGAPVLTIYDADGLKQSALGPGELNVPGAGFVDRITALRLAVLAVAGVQQRESEAISGRLIRALDAPLDFGAWELAAPQSPTEHREPTHARRGGKVADKRSRKAQKAARRKNR